MYKLLDCLGIRPLGRRRFAAVSILLVCALEMISVAAAQAIVVPALVLATVGCLIGVLAIVLFIAAWSTLDASRAGLVEEFVQPEASRPEKDQSLPLGASPVALVRCHREHRTWLHQREPVAFLIAAVNVGYWLLYNVLEDRRLTLVYGGNYAKNMAEVRHMIPVSVGRQGTNQPSHRSSLRSP